MTLFSLMPMVTFSHSAGDLFKSISDIVVAISTPDCSLGVLVRSVMTEEAPRSFKFSTEAW